MRPKYFFVPIAPAIIIARGQELYFTKYIGEYSTLSASGIVFVLLVLIFVNICNNYRHTFVGLNCAIRKCKVYPFSLALRQSLGNSKAILLRVFSGLMCAQTSTESKRCNRKRTDKSRNLQFVAIANPDIISTIKSCLAFIACEIDFL